MLRIFLSGPPKRHIQPERYVAFFIDKMNGMRYNIQTCKENIMGYYNIVGDDYSGYRVQHSTSSGGALQSYPETLQGQKQAEAYCRTLNTSLNAAKGSHINTNPYHNSAGDLFDRAVGGAVVGGVALIGFGLKGIWKIITFPFWLMWIFFKSIFYTFPRFLWRNGRIGRICLCVYVLFWIVLIWIKNVGSEVIGGYINSNWIYITIIMATIVISVLLSIIFKNKIIKPKNKILITILSSIIIIATTLTIGFASTKDLLNIPQKNTYSYVNVSELNVRSGPSPENDIVTILKENTKIQIFKDSEINRWIRIKHQDIEGYVNMDYLRDR
jgi:hypothetical protein